MNSLSLVAAFLIGLSGGLHCVAMCGGISSALGFFDKQRPGPPGLFRLFSYNLGRITSYALIGLLLGGASGLLSTSPLGHTVLKVISGLLLVFIGLQLSGFWKGLNALEKFGANLWQYIQPLGVKLLPINSNPKAFCFGMLWGWLPCGLVYSTLALSASSGSALSSAGHMAAFGLGTLPWLLTTTLAGQQLKSLPYLARLKPLFALVIIGFGMLSLFNAYQHLGSANPHAEHTHHEHQH